MQTVCQTKTNVFRHEDVTRRDANACAATNLFQRLLFDTRSIQFLGKHLYIIVAVNKNPRDVLSFVEEKNLDKSTILSLFFDQDTIFENFHGYLERTLHFCNAKNLINAIKDNNSKYYSLIVKYLRDKIKRGVFLKIHQYLKTHILKKILIYKFRRLIYSSSSNENEILDGTF